MNDTTDTRQQILEAAMERMLHYGYGKTTMSEIARDCNMSAGNIYRFFESKLDIAEAFARKFHTKFYQTYAEIAREDLSAADRLRQFFDFQLSRSYQEIEGKEKILEVVETLASERPMYFNEQLAQERVYLQKILKDGIAAGEFRPLGNADETAEMLQAGLVKFRSPQFLSRLPLPDLQRELNGVMDLLLAGISTGAKVPAQRQI